MGIDIQSWPDTTCREAIRSENISCLCAKPQKGRDNNKRVHAHWRAPFILDVSKFFMFNRLLTLDSSYTRKNLSLYCLKESTATS